jgi:hypothetical protein
MLDGIVYVIGWIVLVLLIIYGVLAIIRWRVSLKVDTSPLGPGSMPVLIPLPIPTKDQPNWLAKLLAFIFEVRKWRLEKAWTYDYEGKTLVIPAGFDFDGASIPRPFWAILNPIGLLLIPGLIHDYGYRYQQIWRLDEDGNVSPYWVGKDKDHWDAVFKKIGKDVNNVGLVNCIAWLAVAVGGKGAWEGWRKETEGEPSFKWSLEADGDDESALPQKA